MVHPRATLGSTYVTVPRLYLLNILPEWWPLGLCVRCRQFSLGELLNLVEIGVFSCNHFSSCYDGEGLFLAHTLRDIIYHGREGMVAGV